MPLYQGGNEGAGFRRRIQDSCKPPSRFGRTGGSRWKGGFLRRAHLFGLCWPFTLERSMRTDPEQRTDAKTTLTQRLVAFFLFLVRPAQDVIESFRVSVARVAELRLTDEQPVIVELPGQLVWKFWHYNRVLRANHRDEHSGDVHTAAA